MSDSIVAVTSAASPIAIAQAEKKVNVKKATAAKSKKATAPPSHPPTQQMVDASIKNLKERCGSSLLAIKKYISATYKCDAQKLAPFIKKYLKSAVANGKLIQTKGKGASGSFKLSAAAKKEPKPKVSSVEKNKKKVAPSGAAKKKSSGVAKKASAAGDKKSKVKKSAATKKTAEKKTKEKAKAKDAKKSGTVKAKSTTSKPKSSAVKPKTPKAKTTTTSAKPKKTASAPKKTKGCSFRQKGNDSSSQEMNAYVKFCICKYKNSFETKP
ncbi:histone H1-like [Scaptodrosophila lebanonensis]|uniref:Histone H1-like n=1 Tax=Drosophila lebanonensis TaxID=7225 RepID=A0A6J2U2H9_DROLE|nr:histone H1-like [Scaptodrosophila lebanonensis]